MSGLAIDHEKIRARGQAVLRIVIAFTKSALILFGAICTAALGVALTALAAMYALQSDAQLVAWAHAHGKVPSLTFDRIESLVGFGLGLVTLLMGISMIGEWWKPSKPKAGY
jgi:hypothetical protein